MQIRAAQGADAPGLVELLRSVDGLTTIDTLADRLEALRRSSAGVALIAIEWGPPTGLVVVNWFHTLGDDLPIAQIDTLMVSPDERRRGVGRHLLKAASQAARAARCGSMRLVGTRGIDASTKAFCEATGFEMHGEVYVRALRKKT